VESPTGSQAHRVKKCFILISLWFCLLFSLVFKWKNHELGSLPPVWDSLAYQAEAMRIYRGLLAQDWTIVFAPFSREQPIGFLLFHVIGLCLFGLKPVSFTLISGFFAFSWMLSFILLALVLGATWTTASAGVVLISIIPEFMYRNFWDTRNDYAMTAALMLSWMMFLKAREGRGITAFWSGVLLALATSLKMTAVSYLFWGMIFCLVWFGVRRQLKNVFLLSIGFLLTWAPWGIFSVTHVLRYYGEWSKMGNWQASQYHLVTMWDWLLYYPKNWERVYLGSLPLILITILLLIGVFRLKSIPKPTKEKLHLRQNLILTLIAAVGAILTLTLNHSLATLADVPALSLAAAVFVVFMSKLILEKYQIALLALILVTSALVLPKQIQAIPIQEVPRANLDTFLLFNQKLNSVIQQSHLESQPEYFVFSHPYLNPYTMLWTTIQDFSVPLSMIPPPLDHYPVANEVEQLFRKIEQLPLIIRIKEDPLTIPGAETFATLNRFHSKIDLLLDHSRNFKLIGSFEVDGFHFSVWKNILTPG